MPSSKAFSIWATETPDTLLAKMLKFKKKQASLHAGLDLVLSVALLPQLGLAATCQLCS
jgi:integral membrane sensor domain MASE1